MRAALKRAREAAGMTQDEAGAAIGRDGHSVYRWETGRRGISATDHAALMAVYAQRTADRQGAGVLRGTSDPATSRPPAAATYPRHLEGMVKRLEADIEDAAVSDELRSALVALVRTPDQVVRYRTAFAQGLESSAEQQARMARYLVAVRVLLEAALADAGAIAPPDAERDPGQLREGGSAAGPR